MQSDDNMQAKELLYRYSCYQKDLQEAKQAAELRKAQKRKGRSIPMSSRPR